MSRRRCSAACFSASACAALSRSTSSPLDLNSSTVLATSPIWCGTKHVRRSFLPHADQGRPSRHILAGGGDAVLRRRSRRSCAVRARLWTGSGEAGRRQQAGRGRSPGGGPGGRCALRAQRQPARAIALTSGMCPSETCPRPPRAGHGPAPIPRRTRSPPPACRAAATGTRERASILRLHPPALFRHPCAHCRATGKNMQSLGGYLLDSSLELWWSTPNGGGP
ncbi:hypothetical protein ACVWW6_004805 [Bradyrhizobium sp. USDA 3311]